MSTQVSYTITSNSFAESNAVESSTSIEKLNSILSRASNNTLSASNIQVKTVMITPTPPDVPLIEPGKAKSNILIIIVIVCVVVCVLIVIVVYLIYFKKRLPQETYNVPGGGYNIVDSQEHCPVCLYTIHHDYIMRPL